MAPRDLKALRKRSKINSRNYYLRKKAKLTERNKEADDDTMETSEHPEPIPPSAGSKQASGISSPQPSLSRRLRSSVGTNRAQVLRTSSPAERSPNLSPLSTPCLSSIHSGLSTPVPNSPSSDMSISSSVLRTDFNNKLRRYQKNKTKQILSLRTKIIQLKREQKTFKKRLLRLSMNLKCSKEKKQKTKQQTPKRILNISETRLRNTVMQFYEDDENSRQCPGKKDCITRNRKDICVILSKTCTKNTYNRDILQ